MPRISRGSIRFGAPGCRGSRGAARRSAAGCRCGSPRPSGVRVVDKHRMLLSKLLHGGDSLRVGVGDRHPLDEAVAIGEVDGAPIGEPWHGQAGHPLKRLAIVDRRAPSSSPVRASSCSSELGSLQIGDVLRPWSPRRGSGRRARRSAPLTATQRSSAPRPVGRPEPFPATAGGRPRRRSAISSVSRRPPSSDQTRARPSRSALVASSASSGPGKPSQRAASVVQVDELAVASWTTTASSSIDMTASRRRSTLSRSENRPALSRARPMRVARSGRSHVVGV